MISPSSSFWLVRALNCLQNSMMLICACPSAGPTGGAGVALPAAICNFTEPVTFFAIAFPYLANSFKRTGRRRPVIFLILLFYLLEFEFHRRGTSEDRNHHFQRLAIFVDFV